MSHSKDSSIETKHIKVKIILSTFKFRLHPADMLSPAALLVSRI